jgi:hypothetical protein
METTTTLSLGQAARLAGVGKTTLARAIRAGRLSATRNETGGYSIEPCELERVFPIRSPRIETDGTGTATVPVVQSATDAATDALVAELRAVIADLRADRDEWRNQAQRLALTPPQPSTTPEPKPRRWWQRRSTG